MGDESGQDLISPPSPRGPRACYALRLIKALRLAPSGSVHYSTKGHTLKSRTFVVAGGGRLRMTATKTAQLHPRS